MPHVVLFRPVYDPEGAWAPTCPWALLCLAAPLVQRGVDVAIIDEPCEPDYRGRLARLLADKPPLAVGVSAMTGAQIPNGLAFSRFVREHCGAAIVWGGIHASLLPEQTAAHDAVDYAIAGEGDAAFPALIEALDRGDAAPDIPGVYFARGGRVQGRPAEGFADLGQLPDLPFALLDAERYIQRRPELGAERFFEVCTSRGCPHRCRFCYVEAVHQSRWRPLDAGAVLDRIDALASRFQLDGLLFREDNFFVDRARVEAVAKGLAQRRLVWAGSCRINYFARYDAAFVRLLRDSGCRLLTFGVESGNPRVLELMHKDITTGQVRATAEKLRGSGIQASFHFMGGFPGETRAEFLDTCRLINELLDAGPEFTVRDLAVFTPYPGVGLIPECRARGYTPPAALEDWARLDWTNPDRPWIDVRQQRLLADARFLIGRLRHPKPAVRRWARIRWRQLLAGALNPPLIERRLWQALRRRA